MWIYSFNLAECDNLLINVESLPSMQNMTRKRKRRNVSRREVTVTEVNSSIWLDITLLSPCWGDDETLAAGGFDVSSTPFLSPG